MINKIILFIKKRSGIIVGLLLALFFSFFSINYAEADLTKFNTNEVAGEPSEAKREYISEEIGPFDAYDAELSEKMKKKLDSLADKIISYHVDKIRIIGFADSLEKNDYSLCQRRADSVANYLMDKGVKTELIEQTDGAGDYRAVHIVANYSIIEVVTRPATYSSRVERHVEWVSARVPEVYPLIPKWNTWFEKYNNKKKVDRLVNDRDYTYNLLIDISLFDYEKLGFGHFFETIPVDTPLSEEITRLRNKGIDELKLQIRPIVIGDEIEIISKQSTHTGRTH